MRVTRSRQPSPDVGCVHEGLHPSGYIHAPHRFLLRRPPAYWEALRLSCHLRYGCNPDDGCDPETEEVNPAETVAERCRAETTPVEDQWAGVLSAFADGELIPELREAASVARDDPTQALAAAAAASVDDIELARALCDLVVTGSGAFARFSAAVPGVAEVSSRLRPLRPALTDEALDNASSWAIERALSVANALRTGFGRAELGWLAVSAQDDPPHRPVNVPVTAHPQFDLEVEVPESASHIARRVRTRTMVASGDPPPPPAPPPGELAPEPTPVVPAEARILVFIHGHSSRLEECEALLEPLTRRGFTVVAMDLPCCGFSQMLEHSVIRTGTAEAPPSGAPALYPVLDFMDSFLVAFLSALSARVGRDLSPQISAFIGGSLGGNLSLRMARRNPLREPFAANVVPWSAASVWDSAAGSDREVGATKARDRAWVDEDEAQRADYFYEVFEFSARLLFVRPQPEYWYRDDGWEPCKTAHIRGARADRQEIYNGRYRRWHWRVAMDQLYFSHRPLSRRLPILGRALLTAATGDNYEWSNIHDATRELAVELLNAPGRLLSIDRTGHSIHVERPEYFAREIAAFCPALCPTSTRPEAWSPAESLDGSSSSDPVAAVQEDGRVLVFTRDGASRIQFRRDDGGGSWSAWASISGGLDSGEGFLSSFAVGLNQDGHLEIFATLDTQPWLAHVWQDGANGAFRDWDKGNHISQLIGGADNGVAVADRVGDGPSRLLLAIARTTSGRVHVRGQNRLGSWWMNGKDLGEDSVNLVGQPALAANQRLHLHLVIRDDAGALRHIFEESPDHWASRWASFGAVASDAAIVLDGAGRLHVFAVGPGGDLRFVREEVPASASSGGRGRWSDWISLGGAVDASVRPAAIRNAWGQLQVFARFDDGSLRTRRQLSDDSRSFSDWLQIASGTSGGPAVVMREDGTLSVFVRASDGSLLHLQQINDYVEPVLEREVTAVRRDADGDVLALCKAGEPWSPRSAAEVIRDIETGAHVYFIERGAPRTEIHVVERGGRKFLRSDPDGIEENNLDRLPPC